MDVQGALDLYVWNLRLGAAFYGPLAIFEVTLRNALHHELAALFGTNWCSDPRFMAMASKVLSPQPQPTRSSSPALSRVPTDLLTDIAKVETRLTRDLQNRAGQPPAPDVKLTPTIDDIVASLDFGYWTNLLNRDLDAILYTKGLYKAFPRFQIGTIPIRRPARSDVAGPLNAIRKFRNRVMHFEPLFKSKPIDEFQQILTVTSWISSDAADWIEHHSSMIEVFRDQHRPRHRFY